MSSLVIQLLVLVQHKVLFRQYRNQTAHTQVTQNDSHATKYKQAEIHCNHTEKGTPQVFLDNVVLTRNFMKALRSEKNLICPD